MAEEKRTTITIYEEKGMGKVKISEEVLAIIAGVAATDVEGVASISGGITRQTILKAGVKRLSKGVTANIVEDKVNIVIGVNLNYGSNVLEVSKAVQEKIKFQIEGMTDLPVGAVSVRVESVDVPN